MHPGCSWSFLRAVGLLAVQVASLLVLTGCIQTAEKTGRTDQRKPSRDYTQIASTSAIKESSDCASNGMLKQARREVSTRNVKTSEKASFFDQVAIGKRAVLTGAAVKGQFLDLAVNIEGEFEEFEGLVTHTVEETKFEASPATAVLTHALTAGVLVLIAPVSSIQHAVGCTDTRLKQSGILSDDANPTGAKRWAPISERFDFEIEVEAFGKNRKFIYSGDNDSGFRIDFEKELREHTGPAFQPIKITCHNCYDVKSRHVAAGGAFDSLKSTLEVTADFSTYLDVLARLKREEQARVAAAEAARTARAEAEARGRLASWLESAQMRSLPWRERLDRAVQAELRQWLTPFDSGLEEIPPPVYPAALSLRQETWETSQEFETRVAAARAERSWMIDRIQTEYRARVELRNRRVAEHNRIRQEREPQLADYRRRLVLSSIGLLTPKVSFSDATLDQQTGALTLVAQIESLGSQTFAFAGTSQAFRRIALSNPSVIKGRPHFRVSAAGDISIEALTIETGGMTARGEPSSGHSSPIELATVTLTATPASVIAQQSAMTVDRNQVEQILYREENESLRKRLEEQRRLQEQVLASSEARAAGEIARVRAEAAAQLRQLAETRPMQNLASVRVAHALVIGNSAYQGNNRLANPLNDARAMAEKLRSLGFQVSEIGDANREQMVVGLAEFSKAAAQADLTLLFYAGHGVQFQGINYMVPVDMSLSDVSQAALQAVSLTQVVEQYLPGKTKLVFLDACRDNPLMNPSVRGLARGLAPINVSEGTLISYATKDGQTADDGVGQENSPFTKALLEHLGDPEDIGIILRTVRSKVMQRTNNRQQPWEYGSLTGGALVLSTIKSSTKSVLPLQAPEADASQGKKAASLLQPPPVVASGPAGASAVPAAAPSRGYGSMLVAAIRRNIVYADESESNHEAEVFVTTRPDGRISSVRITRPSTSRAWDDAVIRALEKTERLPADVNGQVPPQVVREGLVVVLRPKDLGR